MHHPISLLLGNSFSTLFLFSQSFKHFFYSHYPPSEAFDFEKFKDQPAPRLCGGKIADTVIEAQIVRLQNQIDDKGRKIKFPRFAPVIAAGYYVASSGMSS